MKRYCAKIFPSYAHRPGKTPHPNKEGGHSHLVAEEECEILTQNNFKEHLFYLFGLDLYNAGYFWEAHVYWEACWNSCGRKGDIANLLKSLILISAAQLKLELAQAAPALVHLQRAKELIAGLDAEPLIGIDLDELMRWVGSFSEEKYLNTAIGHKFLLA